MSDSGERSELLEVLREIRDAQRETVALLAAQKAFVEEQSRNSRKAIDESIALQRIGLERQRSITRIAMPGILACIAAIAYLVLRYF